MNFDADEVRTLIADYLGIGAKQVTDEAHLGDDLGLDWLNQLELMILIEDEFAGVELTLLCMKSKSSAISSGTSRCRKKHQVSKIIKMPRRHSAGPQLNDLTSPWSPTRTAAKLLTKDEALPGRLGIV